MSAFLTPLDVRLVKPWANDGTGEWELLQAFVYYSTLARKKIIVPLGFHTDFASVPKGIVTWGLFGGRFSMAAVVHDYCVRQRVFARREKADLLFLEAMHVEIELELQAMRDAGEDADEVANRKSALEGRAQLMYGAVALYTKTGFWKQDFDQPGYEPVG